MAVASVEDVAARLGIQPDALNIEQVQAVLADTSALATAYTGIDWNEDGLTVPAAVKAVIVSRAIRLLNNPEGLRQETVGTYSYTLAAEASVLIGGWTVEERAVLNSYGRALPLRGGGSFSTGYQAGGL